MDPKPLRLERFHRQWTFIKRMNLSLFWRHLIVRWSSFSMEALWYVKVLDSIVTESSQFLTKDNIVQLSIMSRSLAGRPFVLFVVEPMKNGAEWSCACSVIPVVSALSLVMRHEHPDWKSWFGNDFYGVQSMQVGQFLLSGQHEDLFLLETRRQLCACVYHAVVVVVGCDDPQVSSIWNCKIRRRKKQWQCDIPFKGNSRADITHNRSNGDTGMKFATDTLHGPSPHGITKWPPSGW